MCACVFEAESNKYAIFNQNAHMPHPHLNGMYARRPRQVPGQGVRPSLAEGVCSMMSCCLPGKLLQDNQLLRERRHCVCSSCRAWLPGTYVTAAPGCSTSGSRACPMPTGKHISSTTNAAALRLATACATQARLEAYQPPPTLPPSTSVQWASMRLHKPQPALAMMLATKARYHVSLDCSSLLRGSSTAGTLIFSGYFS